MGISKRKTQFYHASFRDYSAKIPWKYFIYILKNIYGFEISKKSGSLRALIKNEVRFIVHEPHKGKDDYVRKSDRKKAIRAIDIIENHE